MQIIKSKQNQKIKLINKLKHKKFRKENNMYLVEGIKNVDEALKYVKEDILEIYVSEEYAKRHNITIDYNIISDDVFKSVSEDNNPEGILAILRIPEEKECDYSKNNILILDSIRDPGNLGNILRTVDSLNLGQVIISEDTVDPFMPKVVRASMGAIYRTNIIKIDLKKQIKKLKENGYTIYIADMDGKSIYEDIEEKVAVILSNESLGIDEKLKEYVDAKLSIPMPGEAESLNVATSGAIILYELYRKKNVK